MERTFAIATLATLLAVALSGCFGDDAGPAPDASASPEGHDEGDTGLANATAEAVVRLAAGSFENVTVWHNGTVKRQDLCGPVCAEQRFDLTPDLPEGVVVRLEAALAYTTSEDSLYMGIDTGDADVYQFVAEGGAGFNTVDATLVRRGSGAVEATVGQDLPVASASTVTEIPFSLSIRVTVYDENLPSRVPFALAAQGALAVVGEALSGELRVWAPDDSYLGAFPLAGSETRIGLANASAEGEWVVVAVGLSTAATLAVPRSDDSATAPPVARPLAVEDRVYPPSTVPNQGPLALTEDFSRLPLRLGFYYGKESCCYAMAQVTMTLASPTATVLTINGDCVCEGFEAFLAPWDAAGFVPGVYTATFDHKGSQDVSFGFLTLEYVR